MHPSIPRYTRTAQWLHWSMAAVWLTSWTLGFVATHWRTLLNPDHGLTVAHKSLASTLLVLTVVRVIWRLTHPAPPLPDQMTPVMQRAAHIGHGLLYALALIALPLSGWYWSSVANKSILLLGLVPIPPLVSANPELYATAKTLHLWAAWLCGALVSGHILAALKHHWFDRDTVLRSMLPERAR